MSLLVRVSWTCTNCGGSHQTTVPPERAGKLAGELLGEKDALAVLLEDATVAAIREQDFAENVSETLRVVALRFKRPPWWRRLLR